MKPILNPSLTLGARRPFLSPAESLVTRVQLVLETRPGQIPWEPEFGCNLTSLLGQSATPQRVNESKFRVQSALRRWLPGVELKDVRVNVTSNVGSVSSHRERLIPTAESALVALGTEARLELELDIETEDGALSVEAAVEP